MIPSDFLTREEFQKLLSAARTLKERAILSILGGCGLRVSELTALRVEDIELTALRVEDIDPAKQFIYVRHGKGGKDRTVTAPLNTLKAIDDYMKEANENPDDPTAPYEMYFQNGKDYLFEGRQNGHLSSWEVSYVLNKIAEAALMQEHRPPEPGKVRNRRKITPHLLRHSHASWMLDLNIPVSEVQEQLGHASIATTGIYLKKQPNHRLESFKRHGGDSIV